MGERDTLAMSIEGGRLEEFCIAVYSELSNPVLSIETWLFVRPTEIRQRTKRKGEVKFTKSNL